jgi:hypothetical protein
VSGGKFSVSPSVEAANNAVIDQLVYFSNCYVFFLVGVVVCDKVFNAAISIAVGKNWLLFVLFLSLNAIRAFTMLIFYPILSRSGYNMTWKEALIVSNAGL